MKALPKRLQAVYREIPLSKTVADIGTDHGLLPLQLLKNKVCQNVIVTDISRPSLEKAEKLLLKHGFSNRFKALAGDGLDVLLNNEAETVVIAGMGGLEIITMLKKHLHRFENSVFVLQPMRNTPELRIFLTQNGMSIIKDFTVFDRGKFYSIIAIRQGEDTLTENERFFGRTDLKNPSEDFLCYLSFQENKLFKLLQKVNEESEQHREFKHLYDLTKKLKENYDR